MTPPRGTTSPSPQPSPPEYRGRGSTECDRFRLVGPPFFPPRLPLPLRRESRREKRLMPRKVMNEPRPGRGVRAGGLTAAFQGCTRRSEFFLGTSPLDPASLRLRRRSRADLPQGSARPRSIGLAERLASGSFRKRSREGKTDLEVARASSRALTGTAEGFVLLRGGVTSCVTAPSSPPPSQAAARNGRASGARTRLSSSQSQRRPPRQRRSTFRPRKCVWRRLER